MSFHMRLRRFLADETGNLTMEYMLWLPILLMWFGASAVFFDAYRSRDDAAKAAYVLSDILSRKTVLDDSDVLELVTLQNALLPRASGEVVFRMSSIYCNRGDGCVTDANYTVQNTDYTVEWTVKPDQTNWPNMSKAELFDGLEEDATLPAQKVAIMPPMAHLDSVVLVELSVPFTPFSTWVGLDVDSWDFRVPTRPRFVTRVKIEGAPASETSALGTDDSGG